MNKMIIRSLLSVVTLFLVGLVVISHWGDLISGSQSYKEHTTTTVIKTEDFSEEVLGVRKLPFVPTDQSYFDCDDLFSGSRLDYFNFTETYFKENPSFQNFLARFCHLESDKYFFTKFKVLHFLGSLKFSKSYCETGFNYGHSSFSALTAREDSSVLSFDLGPHSYTKQVLQHFNSRYAERFKGVLGNSRESLPRFIKENPLYKCNFIFIDGSHTYQIGFSDLKHFGEMADENNIVLLDDYPTKDNSFVNKQGMAWEQAKEKKMITELMRCTRKTDAARGFCIGKYNK